MASTYSALKIQLMATGENSGTWGNVTNDNLGIALEEAIVGSEDVTFASGPVTLTLTDTNASQTARNLRLNLVGTSGGAQNLIVPSIEKVYIINNGCADAITVKNSGGTGIAVPAGKTMYVYNNGTNVLDAITHLTSLTLATALPVASGGTGSNTATFSGANITSLNASSISSGTLTVARGGTGATTLNAEAVVIGNTTGAVKFVDPGTTGNVLTSNGTAWLSQAAGGGGGGDYIMTAYTSPATWTKPAGLKAVKVTVIGAGGNGGSGGTTPPVCCAPGSVTIGAPGGGGGAAVEYLDAPAIPGPVTVTVGSAPSKTSSFGPFVSATGGTNGTAGSSTSAPVGPYAGGAGSGGTFNLTGMAGYGNTIGAQVYGGGSALGFGQAILGRAAVTPVSNPAAGVAGLDYGGGGLGGRGPGTGASGGAGIVIVEEFY